MPRYGTLFTIACAAAGALAQNPIEALCATRPNQLVTLEDCVAMPAFAFVTGSAWTAHTVESGDYRLGAIRMTSDSTGTAFSGTSKGPVLLVPGLYANGLIYWFIDGQDPSFLASDAALPERLYLAGYDVWISTRRGGLYSKGHANDAEGAPYYAVNAADYWDFDQQDVGEEDIAALVSYILTTRGEETLDSYKVMLVTHSAGTVEATIALQKYPSDMNDRVSAVVQAAFCPVALESRILSNFQEPGVEEESIPGPCDVVEDPERRALKKEKKEKKEKRSKSPERSEECEATWNQLEYFDRLTEIRERLTEDEWKVFSDSFRAWQRENKKTWKYGNNWQAKVTELACAVDNTPIECASDFFVDNLAFKEFLERKNHYFTYGTDDGTTASALWLATLDATCDADGIAEYPYFCSGRAAQASTLGGLDSVSTKYEQSYLQNTFAKDMVRPRANVYDDGWYAPTDPLDLDLITVPFLPIYLDDDTSCEYQLARDIADRVPSLAQSHTYHDSSRLHFLFKSYNDGQTFEVIDSMLNLYTMQPVVNDDDVTTWDN